MPSNLYYWWNFGSLLGLCLILQITTGVLLSIFYENNIHNRFDSINQIERNINIGWLVRSLHANGASAFFIIIYIHIGRGLFFKSFNLKKVWLTGVILLLILFLTSFIGYVLPWGQIRFWGATVITNLLTSIPYIGNIITIWLWGNFSIEKSTLIRFFSFHFTLPFIIIILIFLHIIFLHKKGSNNPLGSNSNIDKIPFQPYYVWKDLIGVIIYTLVFANLVLIFPYFLIDPDNFTPANPIVTPPHIQPEWYFLFAYAILRSTPNKLGGVLALVISIIILTFLPFIKNTKNNNLTNKFINKCIFFIWINNFIFLTIIGAIPIETPYIINSILRSITYFLIYTIFL